MDTVSTALLTLTLLWNVSALGQQPTPLLPDPKLTPGDVFDVTIQDICTPGYSKKVRAVPTHLKKQAYEVDHLIPLSIGGSNSIRNLWPRLTFGDVFLVGFNPIGRDLMLRGLEIDLLGADKIMQSSLEHIFHVGVPGRCFV